MDYCKALSPQIYGPDGVTLIPQSPMYQLGAQIFHLNENANVNPRPFSKGIPLSGLQI